MSKEELLEKEIKELETQIKNGDKALKKIDGHLNKLNETLKDTEFDNEEDKNFVRRLYLTQKLQIITAVAFAKKELNDLLNKRKKGD